MSEVFSILLHNRQRYEQGKEGLWFSLPTTTEKLQEALREIGISADNPQDFFLYDYRSPQERPIKLPRDLVLSADMDELNFLAARLEKLDAAELAELNAALTSPQSDFHSIGQIIDYPDNVDYYVHLPDVTGTGQLGDYYLNRSGMVDMPEEWKAGIFLPRFGLHIANTEHGVFTDYGYLVKSGDEWQRVHEGQPVPEEYRVMAYPAPEILRDEAPAQTVQPEAAPTAEAAAPPPVVPIILNSQNSADRMKEITDRLETGIQELFESERYKAYLTSMAKFHSYSFNNTLLIAMQGGQLVAGYNKWRDDFHRNVKRGEKGIKILAPAPYKVKKEVPKRDEQGQPMMEKDGKPLTEVQEKQIPAFKIVSVFDVSQTEGEPLPSIGVDELAGNVEQYEDFFKALEQTSPVPMAFEDIPGGSHGYYHLTEKRIAIQENMSELQTLKTAIHEIAHAKLHAIDPEAPVTEQADRPDSRTREVQAESVAYAVCQHYGLDTSDYSFGYVAGWSSGKDLKELRASLETIRATAHELITTIDGHLAELQQQRQAQQAVEQTVEQAAEQPAPDSVFSKLPPEQQQEMTDSVKAMLQTLIDADVKSTGEVTQGTLDAIQTQGFVLSGDGTLQRAEAQEAAYRLESGNILFIQTSENGFDYTVYGPDYKEIDGGQLDNTEYSLSEARDEILSGIAPQGHVTETITGDALEDFQEAAEQANAISVQPEPQPWNGIDGLLNNKPIMPEATPTERANALIDWAERDGQRMGNEERRLIVEYAEAVDNTDKVIALINELCEHGYEMQHGHVDELVKSRIDREIAEVKAAQQPTLDPTAEPVVTILFTESPHLEMGQQMPLHEADALFARLDAEYPENMGYDKTKFRIDCIFQGEPDSYEGRQDFGDRDGSLIEHIQSYHEFYAQDEHWKNHVLSTGGSEAWEQDKAHRDMLLHEFIPYMKLHCSLSQMEQAAQGRLQSGETLTPEETSYCNAVLSYVQECRPMLNQGQYQLPEPPKLSDFDQTLQDYKAQVQAEIAQEAAAAGMTVEEYAAAGYEAPQQDTFSIYQLRGGEETRDYRFEPYERLQAAGLTVDRANYDLVYTAPLNQNTSLEDIYLTFNIDHPKDFKGHRLSVSDVVVLHQNGQDTAHYVDSFGFTQVPEFFIQREKQLTPDALLTGENIQTPRGSFLVTDMSREQMETASYGFHHESEDGKYLIMGNGTQAFAVAVEQPQRENPLRTAELSTEQNENMIDGIINNTPPEPQPEEPEQISFEDVAAGSGQTQEETPGAEPTQTAVRYYPINEGAARRAKEAISFSDYRLGSATAEYRHYIDQAVEIAERQKKRVEPEYHEKIDQLLDTYARKLAENMNKGYEITARVPSVLIAGPANFPVRAKEKQNAASDRNMEEFQYIQGLLDKIRSTGMGGISADDPQAVSKLEKKLEKLEASQELMKAVNAYYRKHGTLDGCPHLTEKGIENLKADMASSWHYEKKPFQSWQLSNNNAEIRRLKGRIEELTRHKEAVYVGWEFEGGTVEINREANRLQIYFEGKPDATVRDEMKSNGFRWSPKAEAWQRQLNDTTIRVTDRIKCIQPLSGEKPSALQLAARREKEKPSIRAQLQASKAEQGQKPPAREKSKGLEVE